jgi:hypothetical protein
MKKITIIVLVVVALFMILLAGSLLYIYSGAGNAQIQSYLEKKIHDRTGLPVVFDRFRLQKGHLYFIAVLGKNASLGFDGEFNLFGQSIDGRYLLKASDFKYKKYTLRQANVAGHISGALNDIDIDGKGTMLNGPVSFKLKIKNKTPQDIIVQLRGVPLGELLALAGIPKIAHGKVNADVLMPSIGRNGSKGKVVVRLISGRFDPLLIGKLYHYTLPPDKTSIHWEFTAYIDGVSGSFKGQIVSDLISARIRNGQINISDKALASDFSLDSKELAPISENRLKGPMKLSGTVRYDTLGLRIRAQTSSLGGDVQLDYTKTASLRLTNVSLSKILHLLAQPDYAEGKMDGKLMIDSVIIPSGDYVLQLSNGKLHSKIFNHHIGTSLPAGVTLSLDSRGKITRGELHAASQIKSNLLTAAALDTKYNIITGRLHTSYKVDIPNPLLLVGKHSKGIPVTIAGIITKDKTLHITGDTRGLGKKLLFDYGDNRLRIAGNNVSVDRLLASTGQKIVVSGLANMVIDFSSLHPLDGDISISASSLRTNPAVLKEIAGKAIATTLALSAKGTARQGILHMQADVNSPLIKLSMPKILFSSKTSRMSSAYHLNIPDLAKIAPIVGVKLQGAFVTDGELDKGQQLSINGSSASLGGTLTYKYFDSQADLKLGSVPLSNLLHMLRQPEQLIGLVDATMTYNVKSKQGHAHAVIDKFQFKPGKLTTAVKVILQKDLSQVIYGHTVVDALISGEKISYKISARGKRSDFVIKDGLFDTKAKTNKGSFGLRIDNLDVIGTIKGPVRRPKISVLPGRMLRSRLKKRVTGEIKKEIRNNIGSKADKILKKIPLF